MDQLAGLYFIGIFAGLVLLALLGILLPFSAYAAQKWAYRTYEQVRKTNEKLDKIIAHQEREHGGS